MRAGRVGAVPHRFKVTPARRGAPPGRSTWPPVGSVRRLSPPVLSLLDKPSSGLAAARAGRLPAASSGVTLSPGARLETPSGSQPWPWPLRSRRRARGGATTGRAHVDRRSICPDHDAVVRQVEQLVRGAPPKEIVVARARGRTRQRLALRLETGAETTPEPGRSRPSRARSSPTRPRCILALMIDPSAALRKTGPDAPPATPVAVMAPPRVEPPRSGSRGAPSRRAPSPASFAASSRPRRWPTSGACPWSRPASGSAPASSPARSGSRAISPTSPAQRGQLRDAAEGGRQRHPSRRRPRRMPHRPDARARQRAPCLGLELDGAREGASA